LYADRGVEDRAGVNGNADRRAMRAYVAVTDHDWYELLASRPGLDEVNFWQPGGSRPFRTLAAGELLLFKLHAPRRWPPKDL
jgi:hypothetical protein